MELLCDKIHWQCSNTDEHFIQCSWPDGFLLPSTCLLLVDIIMVSVVLMVRLAVNVAVFRVSQHESRNKMGLKNLATVFGPTLLRPPSRHSQPKTMEQLFCLAAHETAVQVTVIYQLLLMKSKGVQFEPSKSCITTC